MAINYSKVGWDTTKYFNPTNMNHMDDAIKAACDKLDNPLASYADVMANTQGGYFVDALAVKEGFAAVNSNLNVFTNRFGVSKANILSNNIAYISYPAGFNYNNCIILSCEVEYITNEAYYSYPSKSVFEYVQKNSTGVNVAVLNNEFIGKSVQVVFFKV